MPVLYIYDIPGTVAVLVLYKYSNSSSTTMNIDTICYYNSHINSSPKAQVVGHRTDSKKPGEEEYLRNLVTNAGNSRGLGSSTSMSTAEA